MKEDKIMMCWGVALILFVVLLLTGVVAALYWLSFWTGVVGTVVEILSVAAMTCAVLEGE